MYDIFYYSRTESDSREFRIKETYPSAKKISSDLSIKEIQKKSFTKMFWVIPEDLVLTTELNLNLYRATKWDDQYVHVFKNGLYYDGILLIPKLLDISDREFKNRFFNNKKPIDIVASNPLTYDKFFISNYQDYELAFESSKTNMFWGVWNDLEVNSNFNFDYQVPYYEQHVTHVFKNDQHYDGICLFSKNKKLSKKEIDFRFFIDKKEIDICASLPKPYDRFVIDTYEDYLNALENTNLQMFWGIWKDIEIIDSSKFNLYFSHHNSYDRKENHNFKNIFRKKPTYTNGIVLFSKDKPVSRREIKHRFMIEKKEHDIILSKTRPYDIVFISYNEPNADENYQKLLEIYPNALRIDKVKGIHQAHIEAAKKAQTDMFWVVDGDAQILSNFNFDYEVSTYEKDIVHVWRSQNPINDLVYGYGGVKLLPRDLTENMRIDTADMTTSISKRFKAISETSNMTVFNTDPFNTWKSAFRECVKLSSKIIDGQVDEETSNRLSIWCTVGEDKPHGKYAIIGANMGRIYGKQNSTNLDKLKLINDFDWLKKVYNEI